MNSFKIWFALYLSLFAAITSTARANNDITLLNSILEGRDRGVAGASTPTDLGQFLEVMSRRDEMPEGYYAIYKSKSPQKASFETPRILLKWRDSIFAFSPTQPEHLEVMTFNQNEKKFEFYLYRLPFDSRNPPKKNPSECLACHAKPEGTPPKPRWESYNLWPGFFGSNDGRLSGLEKDALINFKAHQSTHPIYKYLRNWPDQPYKTPDCDPPSQIESKADPKEEMERLKGSLRYRLVDLGIDLLAKQQESIIHDILHSKLSHFRYAILGAALCPSAGYPTQSFLPSFISEQFNKSYQEVLQDTVAKNEKNYSDRYTEVLKNTGLDPKSESDKRELRRTHGFLEGERSGAYSGGFYKTPEASAITARIRYIIEGAGQDMSTWSLSSIRQAYSFSQGCFDFERPNYWKDLLNPKNVDDQVLLELLKEGWNNLRARDGTRENAGYTLTAERELFCEALKDKSLTYLSSVFPLSSATKEVSCSQASTRDPIQKLSTDSKAVIESIDLNHKAQCIEITRGEQPMILKIDKMGIKSRSIEFPQIGKLKFYNSDVSKVLQHLENGRESPKELGIIRCGLYRCRQFGFSNGDIITVYQSDEERFKHLFKKW